MVSANSADVLPPALTKAMSIPLKSSLCCRSFTSYSLPLNVYFLPADPTLNQRGHKFVYRKVSFCQYAEKFLSNSSTGSNNSYFHILVFIILIVQYITKCLFKHIPVRHKFVLFAFAKIQKTLYFHYLPHNFCYLCTYL